MGIIKRQSLKNSIVNYLGVFIGTLSMIFIYPLILPSDLGLFQFVISTSALLSGFAGWGFNTAAVHFYSFHNNNLTQKNAYFWWLSSATLLSSLTFVMLVFCFRNGISEWFGKENAIFLSVLPYILCLAVIVAFSNLYTALAASSNRIVVPTLLNNLFLKVTLPVLVLLFYNQIIETAVVLKGILIVLLLSVVGLYFYLFFLKQMTHRMDLQLWRDVHVRKDIFNYSSFIILVGISSIMVARLDQIIIAPILGYGSVAVFTFGATVAEAIDIPRKAIGSISAPLISESIKANNMPHVLELYRKSALLQLVIGSFLLIGVWSCSNFLFDLMPKHSEEYRDGKYVILFLGLAKVVDMGTGLNHEIITFSKYYKFNLWSLTILAVLNVLLNFYFISKSFLNLGIVGSALATLLSMVLFNIWRMAFIYQKMHMHPLQINMLKVIIFALIAWFLATFIPSVSSPILNIFIKGSMVTLVYWAFVIYYKISPDVNDSFEKMTGFMRK